MVSGSGNRIRTVVLWAAGLLSLVAFPAAAPAATEQVQDGSFEAGFSGWAFESGAERCEAISPSCGAFPAATGSFYGASKTLTSFPAKSGAHLVGTITQLVATPELPATLSFKVREISNVGALGTLPMLLKVKYDGQAIEEIASAAETFGTVVAPIPAPLAGPTARPLTFEITCFNDTTMSESCARFDVDDVSLIVGTGPLQPAGPGPQPTAPADTTAPETALAQVRRIAKVRSLGARAKVKARFTSESGARFECKIDRRPYGACKSPKTLRLKVGRHVFRVRAVDAAGNIDPSPAKAVVRVKLSRG